MVTTARTPWTLPPERQEPGLRPRRQRRGRAIVVAWPPTHWSTLPVPDTFDQSGIDAAAKSAAGALGLAGALPLVLWRRRKINQRLTEKHQGFLRPVPPGRVPSQIADLPRSVPFRGRAAKGRATDAATGMSRTRRYAAEGHGKVGSALSGIAVAPGCVLFLGGFV